MAAQRNREAEHSGGEINRRGMLKRAGTAGAAATAVALGAPVPAALAAPAAQAAGGTLRLNLGSEPDSIDPQKASFVHEIEVIMRVFRNLLQFDANGNIIPDLAESMPTVEENGTLFTFKIREDAYYSDGVPVRAQDFVFAWRRHMDPRTEGQYSFLGNIIAGAETLNLTDAKNTPPERLDALREAMGVRALDDKTLQIKTIAPAPWFLSVLCTWCGVATREDKVREGNGGDEFGSKWTEPATYIGTGPYVLAEWDHNNRMRFTANDRYYAGAPAIRNVEEAMIAEAAVAFAAYLNDELDMTGVISEFKPQVDADPNLRAQFVQYPSPTTIWMAFNNTKAPFDNRGVRLAFSHAIDRVSYIRNIEGGRGIPARQLIPPGFAGHFEYELEEQIFNPDIARRLLAEAGFPGGKGLPEIKMAFASTAASRRRAEALAAMLKQHLGIDVLLDPIEPRTLVAMRKSVQTFPQLLSRAGWHQDYNDPQNWYSTVFNSKNPVDKTGWVNPEFDRLTDAADIELDPERRRELYRQAAQIFLNDAPVVLLYHEVVWSLIKPRIIGYKPDPTEYFVGEHQLQSMRLAE